MINYKKIFSGLFMALLMLFCGMLMAEDAVAQIKRTGLNGEVTYGPYQTPSGGTIMGKDHAAYEPITSSGATNDGYSSACKGNTDDGIFSSLVCTGRLLFEDLRELIYIVAGFGIIAVGVGGIFGNLNWKWLGAIIISLVIIATAGELISVMLGDAHGIGNSTTKADAIELTLKE